MSMLSKNLEKSLHRAFDGQPRAGLRHILHDAVAPPGAVDAHHVRADPTFECDALTLPTFCSHHLLPRALWN